MRRFSQRSHLVTLSDINITPLLDLAFVLLVIFIITTAPPVNDKDITLPTATDTPKGPKPDVNYITVDSFGNLFLNAYPMKNEDELLEHLVDFRIKSPNLNVVIRGDARIQYQKIISVLDVLVSAKVDKVGLATETVGK